MPRPPANADVVFHRDPDLPGVELRLSSYSEHAFRKHSHDAYSIALVEEGASSFELAGTMHRAVAGQLVFVDPEAVHACNPDSDTKLTYRLFYIDARWFDDIGAEVLDPSPGRISLAPPVASDAELFGAWRNLHVAILECAPALEKESALVSNIATTIERYATGRAASRSAPVAEGAVAKAREVLTERLAERVSLDELASSAGLSRFHLLRVFREATGLPPHAFQSQLRVEAAKRLLAAGEPIVRVATQVGFADQSHFTRVFREFTGATPSQYRASRREIAPADSNRVPYAGGANR